MKSIDSLDDEQFAKLLSVMEAKKSGSEIDTSGLIRNPDTGIEQFYDDLTYDRLVHRSLVLDTKNMIPKHVQ